jgi:16S rRNA (cytosine967-C5)-methyltransferase
MTTTAGPPAAGTAGSNGLAARRAALGLLHTILDRRQSLGEALRQNETLPTLPSADRAFARLMAHTVLRRLPEIDAIYGQFLQRPLPGRASTAKHLLRIGTVQLVHLKTPAHAAVDTAVRLADSGDASRLKGLINAVLRKVAANAENDRARAEEPETVRMNTPNWLWRCWRGAYGEEATAAIARAHLAEPPLDITVKSEVGSWSERLDATLLPNGSLRRRRGGDPTGWPGYSDGEWWIQDAAAALPARLLGNVAGKSVLDLCAAPGGKTAQFAVAGAKVTAVDISRNRTDQLSENLARLGLAVETVVADMRDWRPPEPADIVFLDAPCSATGTCRRNPDILRLRQPDDIEKLAHVQETLLDDAAEMVAPGGLLVYVTCSLQPEEGPNQIAAFTERRTGFAAAPFDQSLAPELGAAFDDTGALRTLPCHWGERGGMDGFFAVALQRVSD